MKRIIGIIFLSLACVAVLVLVVVGVLLATLDVNNYKEEISAAVQKATGRVLIFEGDLKTSFFPTLALETGRLRLEDPPGFGQDPFASVESASFSLALGPLFHGEARVKEVTLRGVTVKLVRASDGAVNWEMGPAKPAKEGVRPLEAPEAREKPSADSKAPADKRLDLQVDSLRCNDISVTYRDMTAGASYRLRIADFEMQNVRPDADIPITFSGSAADEASGVGVEVALIAQLRVESTGNAGLTVKNLEITARNRAKQSLAFSLAGDARYNGQSRSLVMENLKGSLAGTSYEAGFTVLLPGAEGTAPGINRDVRGSIRLGKVDLDVLLPVVESFAAEEGKVMEAGGPVAEPAEKAPSGSRHAVRPASRSAGGGMSGLHGDVQIDAAGMTVSKLPLTDISARLVVDKGAVTVTPFSFKLFDGSVNGNADCDLRADPPDVHAVAVAKGVSVRHLLLALAGKDFASGKADLNMDVQGKGLAWAELAPTLGGTAKVLVTEGEARGFNLIPSGLPGVSPVPTEFSVERLSASWTGSKGVFTSRDVLLLSPALKAEGGGTVNLPGESTAMHLDFLVGGLPPAIPLKIEGPFAALKYNVDMEALVRNTARGVLESPEKAGELLKQAPDKAGTVIKGVEGLFR